MLQSRKWSACHESLNSCTVPSLGRVGVVHWSIPAMAGLRLQRDSVIATALLTFA
jgi:hypothetical protein